MFGLLLLTGKWVTACLLLGVCAWDVRTYLRGEHKVRCPHALVTFSKPLSPGDVHASCIGLSLQATRSALGRPRPCL